MTIVTTRPVRIQLEQAVYDRARQAAAADRRSLANWLAVTVERALEDKPSETFAVDGDRLPGDGWPINRRGTAP